MNQLSFDEMKSERNRALETLDMDYARKIMPHAWCDEVRLIALHKARYECTEIADGLRRESERWLKHQGYRRIDRMEFPTDGSLPK